MSDEFDDDSADLATDGEGIPSCPGCGCTHAPEIKSTKLRIGKLDVLRSRRECRHCGRRFYVTTNTKVDEDDDE